jgi:predicted DNA-binding transcriptional regulator AlpA
MTIRNSLFLFPSEPDPVLPFEYLISDLGCSKATFHRGPRHELPVLQISQRRLGVRRSDYEKWKASKIQAPVRAA